MDNFARALSVHVNVSTVRILVELVSIVFIFLKFSSNIRRSIPLQTFGGISNYLTIFRLSIANRYLTVLIKRDLIFILDRNSVKTWFNAAVTLTRHSPGVWEHRTCVTGIRSA